MVPLRPARLDAAGDLLCAGAQLLGNDAMSIIEPPSQDVAATMRDIRALRADLLKLSERVTYVENMLTSTLEDYVDERKRVLQSGIKDTVARENLG